MIELTLQGAKDVIERTKACQPQCSECSVFNVRAYWTVMSGKHPPLVEEELQADLCASVHAQLGPEWVHENWRGSDGRFLKRCEKCAATPEFPWAQRLDAEKVLAFMETHPDVFWLGELEKTL